MASDIPELIPPCGSVIRSGAGFLPPTDGTDQSSRADTLGLRSQFQMGPVALRGRNIQRLTAQKGAARASEPCV